MTLNTQTHSDTNPEFTWFADSVKSFRTNTVVRVGKVLKAEEMMPANDPLTLEEVQNKYPVGIKCNYTLQSKNAVVPITILWYKWEYAILTTGKQWIRIKISNLVEKLSSIPKTDNVVRGDFWNNKQKKKKMSEPKTMRQIDDGLVHTSEIARTFTPYKDISELESRALLKNQSTNLKRMDRYLNTATHPQAIHQLTSESMAPVGKIRELFWKISWITDNLSRDASMKTFVAYYIRFLATRRDFLVTHTWEITQDAPISKNTIPAKKTKQSTAIEWEYIPKDEYTYDHIKKIA